MQRDNSSSFLVCMWSLIVLWWLYTVSPFPVSLFQFISSISHPQRPVSISPAIRYYITTIFTRISHNVFPNIYLSLHHHHSLRSRNYMLRTFHFFYTHHWLKNEYNKMLKMKMCSHRSRHARRLNIVILSSDLSPDRIKLPPSSRHPVTVCDRRDRIYVLPATCVSGCDSWSITRQECVHFRTWFTEFSCIILMIPYWLFRHTENLLSFHITRWCTIEAKFTFVICSCTGNYRPIIGLYRENAIAIESEANYSFGGNVYYVTMQITLPIPEFTRNERNFHCDVLHIAPDRVVTLVLDDAIAAIQTSR